MVLVPSQILSSALTARFWLTFTNPKSKSIKTKRSKLEIKRRAVRNVAATISSFGTASISLAPNAVTDWTLIRRGSRYSGIKGRQPQVSVLRAGPFVLTFRKWRIRNTSASSTWMTTFWPKRQVCARSNSLTISVLLRVFILTFK